MAALCACKGIRKCLICEPITHSQPVEEYIILHYCSQCHLAFPELDITTPCSHESIGLPFPGIGIHEHFITEDEEAALNEHISNTPWVDSQSGRRKQDFGPQVNFKHKRIRVNKFSGLPPYVEDLVTRLHKSNCLDLDDFDPVELCNLEYLPIRGSSIDPHFDDFWLWGERLLTLNLLSDTWLTMTLPYGSTTTEVEDYINQSKLPQTARIAVKVPLIRRSLVNVYGPSRHKWQHAVWRGDIKSRRIAMTFRELSAEFHRGGVNENLGYSLLNTASSFRGVSVAEFSRNAT